jgi:hypothetical protein
MSRQRRTLNATDLTSAALVQSGKTGKVYRLGPPKLRNVNKNVVNHCQLYYRSNGKLVSEKWYNLSNLKQRGFKLYVPVAPGTLPLIVYRTTDPT